LAEEVQIARVERQLAVAGVPLGKPDSSVVWFVSVAAGTVLGFVAKAHLVFALGLGGGLIVSFYVGWAVFTNARARRFSNESNLAIAALGRGELEKARAIFVRWATSRHPVVSGLARHNLSWTLMLEGRIEEAVTLIEDTAVHHARGLARPGILSTTRVDAGIYNALLGKLDAATAWYEKAREPQRVAPMPTFPAMLAILEAVIACRTERAAEAVVVLERAWTEHEAAMTGEIMRMMRVVRAFALAASGSPRSQGVVEQVLGDMRPRYAGELTYLGSAWPEMAMFLAAHRLDT
jgi:hypothetical protein